ncbi:unnamed protein product, partial [Mesorhabditis spiculigera]
RYDCSLTKKVDNVDQDCTYNRRKIVDADAQRIWFTIRDLPKDKLIVYRCGLAETFCLSKNNTPLADEKIGCYQYHVEDPGCNCQFDGDFTFTPADSDVLALWKQYQKSLRPFPWAPSPALADPPSCGTYEVPDTTASPSNSASCSSWPSSPLLLSANIILVVRFMFP